MQVVVYTAHEAVFSGPILDQFEKKSGIKVVVKYDTESTKTVGLVNVIRAEKDRPRGDVFWNNEIVNTLRLKQEGLLAPCWPKTARPYPAAFKDPAGCWYGFAARARVLIVNTNLVQSADEPASIYSLADPKWKGRVGMAKPLFGTTATHAACLFASLGDAEATGFFQSLKDNEIRIQSGNKAVAMNVGAGNLAFGITDTDDALDEFDQGKPVRIVYPDSRPGQLGVLFIPNTLALIRGGPSSGFGAGEALIEYLLSPETETALANGRSAQIPLNPEVRIRARVKTPADVQAMNVDFAKAAACFEPAAKCMEKLFLK
jgi:iron(III) transport system substrate-binding protein